MERAGAEPEIFVINNLTPAAVAESVEEARRIIERLSLIHI